MKKNLWQQIGRDVPNMPSQCEECGEESANCECEKEEKPVSKDSIFKKLSDRLIGDKNLGEVITDQAKKYKK